MTCIDIWYYGPKIHDELEKIKLTSKKCDIHFLGELKFEIEREQRSFEIDLESRTYGYRKWDFTGVPCMHAGSMIIFVLISNINFV